ncbi:FAD dependent oxidoreductase [Lepidopterella palustris CBS 459.81]|uniref:FAD dependent oxidoreductase n=1 Tax=Lepidopterella palustris CBS 459.81 TaxID=1314670 RepID=A0A8E2JJI3_9PEZI|nr:FAD dependent oxidoreductase [Lepidopterella palustris CBS 459.81]
MPLSIKNIFSLVSIFVPTTVAVALPDHNDWKPQDIITRDVCIIGGGATGTYSAVRLRQDMNKSVIVVEQKDRLGGHTETFFAGQYPIDYGVQAFHNFDVVKNFFGRFKISLSTAVQPPFLDKYVDLTSGKVVPNYPPDLASAGAALGIYAAAIAKYPYLAGGYFLPDPVPDELLMPFGEFVNKYHIEAALPTIWTFAHGCGDILTVPTLYIIQNFGLPQLADLLGNSFLTTTNHANSQLYLAATALLGSDVLFGSTVISANRPAGPTKDIHEIVVSTPSGRKLIRAKKLLITIPPIAAKLSSFDLDTQESGLFAQWTYSGYFIGVLANTGIPDNTNIINAGLKTPLNIPKVPFEVNFDFSGIPGLFTFKFVSHPEVSTEHVQGKVSAAVLSMAAAGTLNTTQPEFLAFSSHTPTQLRVSADAVKGGFYGKLYALQGHRQTWWTGAAWAQDDSSLLWQFTEAAVLPGLAA